MKKAYLFLLFAVWCLVSTAQQFPTRKIESVNPYQQEMNDATVILEMSYARPDVLSITGDSALLGNASAVYVQIICTDYPAFASLDALNHARWEATLKALPRLPLSCVKGIEILRQLKGSNRTLAEPLFHGVVLKFPRPQGPETMRHDMERLKVLLDGGPGPSPPATPVKKPLRDTSALSPPPEDDKGEVVLVDSLRTVNAQGDTVTHYTYTLVEKNDIPRQDSTVWKILERNHFQHMAVTADVTGSMYPYTSQLLRWLKQQSVNAFTTHYNFFNDGDMLEDAQKVIGKTGGIYPADCPDYDSVKRLVFKVMSNGGGGDAPENDVEALLVAGKRFPDIHYHLLIADNWAPVKDLSLVKQLHKPVRIVLCGVQNEQVHADYLNLARDTGGSVHVADKDFTQLASMHEGEELHIGKNLYRIVQGRFKLISPG